MNKYNMDPDMIVCAYEYVKDKHGSSRPVKYIESIIFKTEWRDHYEIFYFDTGAQWHKSSQRINH